MHLTQTLLYFSFTKVMYVDDIIVMSSDNQAIERLLQELVQILLSKNLGPLHYFLGIEVSISSRELLLTQSKYAKDFVHLAGLKDCKVVHTPMSVSEKLVVSVGEPFGQ